MTQSERPVVFLHNLYIINYYQGSTWSPQKVQKLPKTPLFSGQPTLSWPKSGFPVGFAIVDVKIYQNNPGKSDLDFDILE